MSCRYPSGPPLGVYGSAGLPGRCKHRPLRTLGRALPGFAGYLRGRAAMHPSVCALRRIHLPLQGRLLAGGFPGGSVVAGGWRDDASIAPYGRGAGPCRGLKDTCGAGRQCTPPPALRAPPLAGEAFGGRLSRWVGDYGRFPGRCKHRPLRTLGRALPEFAGYPWGKAAMHPSVGWRASRLRGAAHGLTNTPPGRRKPPRRA